MVSPEATSTRTSGARRRPPFIVGQHFLSIGLVFAILVTANILARRHYVRFDLTEERELSLAPATREILGDLEDLLVIKGWFSEEIPPAYAGYLTRVSELLLEYRANGGGRIDVDIVDPLSDPREEDLARGLGIGPARFQMIERDRRVVAELYCAIGVFYRDQHATINLGAMPAEQWARQLEYELTRSVVKVTTGGEEAIGFVADTEPPPQRGQRPHSLPQFYQLRDHLTRQAEVVDLDLAGGDVIPEGVTTLVVIRPRALDRRALFEIDQFLMRGGRALFFVDRYDVQQTAEGAKPIIRTVEFDPGLIALLRHYGVGVESGLVQDEACDSVAGQRPVRIGNMTGYRPVQIPLAQWIRAEGDGVERNHPMVAALDSVSFRFASPLTLDEEGRLGKVVTEIIRSSEASWIDPEPQDFSPDLSGLAPEAPPNAETGPQLLAVVVRGVFESFFEGELPPLTDEEKSLVEKASDLRSRLEAARGDDAPDPESSDTDEGEGTEDGSMGVDPLNEGERAVVEQADRLLGREVVPRSPKTRIMVVGDADFVADGSRNPRGNLFAMNAIDWFSVAPEVIEIRTRGNVDRSLRELGDRERFWVKLANIAGIPVLVVLLGLARLVVRRWRRHA